MSSSAVPRCSLYPPQLIIISVPSTDSSLARLPPPFVCLIFTGHEDFSTDPVFFLASFFLDSIFPFSLIMTDVNQINKFYYISFIYLFLIQQYF